MILLFRANRIRDETIGVEYKKKHRKNVFIDSRLKSKSFANGAAGGKRVIGEHDDFDVEKFAIEARKKINAGRAFTSGFSSGHQEDEDEVVLTHRGKSLADVERLESPMGSDDEGDDKFNRAGNLTSEQTDAMFGGGVFEKKRDYKEIMLDVIAKSKKFKYERQQEREKVTDAFEKLDQNYSMISKMASKYSRTNDDKV